MGLKANFSLREENAYTHATSTRLALYIEVLNEQGNTANLSVFSEAEYVIKDKNKNTLITKTLGDGITKNGNYFVVFVPREEIDLEGTHFHEFALTDNNTGERLSPVFSEPLFFVN